MTRCYGIDVGNSRVKIRLLPDCDPPLVGAADSRGLFAHQDSLIATALAEPEWIWTEDGAAELPEDALVEMIAVRPAVATSLTRTLEARGCRVRLWTVPDLPIAHPYAEPASLGVDRPLAALAAGHLVGAPAIVVDAGTALTVDLLDRRGHFAGGAIAPGFGLLARSLGAAGAMLKLIDEPKFDYPGRSTKSALELGVTAAFSGALMRLVAQAKNLESKAPIVVCGGDADLVAELLGPKRCLKAPLLTIGLWLLSRRPRS